MSYENSAGLGVSNHYGARATSVAGSANGNDIYRQASYAVNGDLVQAGVIPSNAVVTDWHTLDTGAPSALSVGGVDVLLADGVAANAIPASGLIEATGVADGGKVIIEFYTI
jgi:hypothetical protein